MSENFVTLRVTAAVVSNGNSCPRCVPAVAAPLAEQMVSVPRAMLKKWQRDLDACQKVIWLAGGFDPAYCKDAKFCIGEMDVLLAKLSTQHHGDPVADSIAQMVTEWVETGIKLNTDWRNGLAGIIQKRLARFPANRHDGYCSSPDYCVCGGDTQGVRETCDHWVKS